GHFTHRPSGTRRLLSGLRLIRGGSIFSIQLIVRSCVRSAGPWPLPSYSEKKRLFTRNRHMILNAKSAFGLIIQRLAYLSQPLARGRDGGGVHVLLVLAGIGLHGLFHGLDQLGADHHGVRVA